MGKITATGAFLLALLLLTACSGDTEPSSSTPAEPDTKAQRYTELGDLPALKKQGIFRILVHSSDDSYLPRDGMPVSLSQDRLERFAIEQGMKPELVAVNNFEDLIPLLTSGHGDVIAANLTITEQRQQQLAFTHALAHVTEHLVSARGHSLSQLAQLEDRTLAVQRNTSFWHTAEKLQREFSGLQIEVLPGALGNDEIFDRVATDTDTLTLADSNVLDTVLGYRDDLQKSGAITGEQAIAWGVRQDNTQLLSALNDFIIQEKLTRPQVKRSVEDWPAIKQRKRLRVALRNNSASYFLWRGKLLGFDYELLEAFAEQHKLRLDVVVASDQEQLLSYVRSGRADIAAGFLTPNAERRQGGITFSAPYHLASELIVARPDDHSVNDLKDLAGRTVHVRESSSYWQTISRLQQNGIAVELAAIPENEETEAAIAKVAAGSYDLSAADNHILDIELTWRDDIEAAFALGDPVGQSWALRAHNPQLLKQLNAYIGKAYRGLFYNMTYKKYFTAPKGVAKLKTGQRAFKETGELSPYDLLVKKYAEKYQFDWRLVTAQMYQESRFNPKAKSWAGALGLLQVMPATARELGFSNIQNPENGIHAGIKYLDWVRQRFPETLPVADRMWFTLAAYNAGAGHVRDAIVLARQQGLNPDRWFDNVEQAMLLLSKRQYAAKARHGYVRGEEPVKYVREIRQRFGAYVQLTEADKAAANANIPQPLTLAAH